MSQGRESAGLRLLGAAMTGAGLLALASCGGGDRDRLPPPPKVGKVAPLSSENSAAMVSPERYMTLAASDTMFAIQASEIAVSRASDTRLRSVADTIARDQLGISAQLSFAGRRLNLLPSAVVTPRHRAMLDELRGAGNFDATYKRQMGEVLGSALSLHRAYASRGSSPTLRPVSSMAAPIIGREVTALRRL